MRGNRVCWAVGGVVMAALAPHARGLNCDLARTPQERAICGDAKLRAEDATLNAAYAQALAGLSPAAAGAMREDARAWLHWRDTVCPGVPGQGRPIGECLRERYEDRIALLRSGATAGGMRFYPRSLVETAPDTEKPDPSAPGFDPGFGIGSFSWLATDRPTAAQTAWNAALAREIVTLSAPNRPGGNGPQTPPTKVDPAGIADGEFFVTASLRAANAHYVLVELDQSFYEYGGAHGGDSRIPFAWWLDRGRVLAVSDLFAGGDRWKQPFAALCYEKLMRGPHRSELFLNGDSTAQSFSSRKDVDAASTAFGDWLVDGSGITVVYPEYSIAPYSSGILTVHLLWSELQARMRPFLARDFDPGVLPQPVAGRDGL